MENSYKTSMASTQSMPMLSTHSSQSATDMAQGHKVPTARKAEMVQVKKECLDMLLAKLDSQGSKLNTFKNVHLVIQDFETKLKAAKVKNVQLETALVSAEAQLMEWIKVQLDKPESALDMLPQFLHDELKGESNESGKETVNVIPQTDTQGIKEKMSQPVHQAKSAPELQKCFEADDLESDGTSPLSPVNTESFGLPSIDRDSAYSEYPGSRCVSIASSGYHSRRTTQELESLQSNFSTYSSNPSFPHSITRRQPPIIKCDKQSQTHAVSPVEYERIINQQVRELAKRKLQINQLHRLLEAKSNSNCDVFTQQLSVALKKNDELSKSNKQKDTLLGHYSKAYAALSQEAKVQVEKDKTIPFDKTDIDSLSAEKLKSLVGNLTEDLNERHMKIIELKGELLQSKQTQDGLEAKLQEAHNTVQGLYQSRRSQDELPISMGQLRDENRYLKETLSLKEKSSAKMVQEKEHLLAQNDLLRRQQDELKKQIEDLRSKSEALQQKLDQNESQEDQYRRVLSELDQSQQRVLLLEQHNQRLQKELEEQKEMKDQESIRWGRQFKQMIDARKKIDDQLRALQSQEKQSQRRIQQYKKQASEQQQLILQLQGLDQQQHHTTSLSSHPAPSLQWQQPRMQTVSDSGKEEAVECERCFREFKLSEYEKFEAHRKKCSDD